MGAAVSDPSQLNTPDLLEAFFERSQDGFFFMMLDQPIEWGSHVDQDAVLDYVFSHQRMTKVNPAMAKQFRATPSELIGLTPGDFFRHDVEACRRAGERSLTRVTPTAPPMSDGSTDRRCGSKGTTCVSTTPPAGSRDTSGFSGTSRTASARQTN